MRFVSLVCFALLSFALQAQDLLGDLRDRGLGFAQVLPGKILQFPRDHGAHPDYRIEWWYLTANLTDAEGQDWGLQWTLFRQSLSPEQAHGGWQSNQIWMAHAAITTPEGHFHEERFARGDIGQAGVTRIGRDGYFNAWMDDWQWLSSGAALLPARLDFNVGERELSLTLEADGELVTARNLPRGRRVTTTASRISRYTVSSGKGPIKLCSTAWAGSTASGVRRRWPIINRVGTGFPCTWTTATS
jgi:predicted secreted hydrolase